MAATAEVQHVVVTLTGAAQALPAFTGAASVRWLSLQPGTANGSPVFVGGAAVSNTSYGTRLPASVASEPCAPFIVGEFEDGTLDPTKMYVYGANNEKLHLTALVYVRKISTRGITRPR